MKRIVRCRISDIREDLGLSAYRLAQLIGHKQQSSVSRIENGHKFPSLETAFNLAHALGCSVEDLYETEEII